MALIIGPKKKKLFYLVIYSFIIRLSHSQFFLLTPLTACLSHRDARQITKYFFKCSQTTEDIQETKQQACFYKIRRQMQ